MLINKKTKGKIYASLSLALLITLSVPAVSKANAEGSIFTDKSVFYMQVINNGMPIMKSIGLDEDDLAEYNYSVKDNLLDSLGLDVNSPLSIVSREFNLIKDGDPETAARDTETPFILNPFKLNENNIIKNTEVKPTDPDKPVDYAKVAEIYNPKIKKTLNPAKPEVLIYHSHTTESFSPNGNYNTDNKTNVTAIGDVIKTELEKNYGIAVIHDKTVHNLPLQTQSYTKSGKTVDTYLKNYKDFKIIIDLHRDGIPEKNAKSVVAELNKTNIARYEYVIGTGNPNKAKNLALAHDLVKISESLFPGLVRPGNSGDKGIYNFKSARFHQHKNPNILLIEVGAQTNTIEEVKSTGVYIARVFAEYINGKK